MSDFLHRLARRTLSPEQLVRPRLASLFERADAPFRPAAAITEEESFEQALELDTPRPRPPRPTSAAPEPEAEAQRSPAGPPRPARSIDPGAVSVPVSRRRPPARPPRHEPVPPRLLLTSAHPAVLPEPADVEPPPAPLSDAHPAARAGDPDERPAVPARASAIGEQPKETPVRSTPPVAVEVSTRPDRPTRREQRLARKLPQLGPAVHVSIGRVEVRAVAAPAAPRERAPEAQRGKRLDEYLRERDRGAR